MASLPKTEFEVVLKTFLLGDIRSLAKLMASGFALALCLPFQAHAAAELVLQLDTSLRSDSNPLRFTEGPVIPPSLGISSPSDTIFSTDIRGAVIYPLDSPETRLVLTGQLGRRNYNQLTQLDNTEYAYRAALEWRYGTLWKGELFHSQEQQLYGYLDGSLTTREMIHRTTDSVELALRATPEIEIPLILRSRRTRYDSPVNLIFESTESSADAGIRLKTGTNSTARVGARTTSVSYPQRTAAQIALLDSRYQDNELYLESDWQYSVFTRLSGRVAALKRSYDSLEGKSFSALTTELRVLYDYSSLTRLTLELWNRPYGTTDRTTLYTIATGVQAAVRWQATPKTRFTAQATNELQRYQSIALQPGQSNPELNRVRLGGGFVYAVTKDVSMYVDGFREHLNRGNLGPNIVQNTLRAGLEYTFENTTGVAQRTGLGERRQAPLATPVSTPFNPP